MRTVMHKTPKNGNASKQVTGFPFTSLFAQVFGGIS